MGCSFFLLDCFHRVYTRGLFTEDFRCPVSLSLIDTYLQFLLPAFQFNLVMQKTSSTIGDVVPTLHIIISKWKRYDLPQSYRQLGFAFIENKFSYELNSRNICSCCFI